MEATVEELVGGMLGGKGICMLWQRISHNHSITNSNRLFAQILVYVALGLLLSMFLPSRSLSAMLTGLLLVASYFVSSLSFMDERLGTLAKLMPYHYFQTVLTFTELNLGWLFALLGTSLLMTLLAWLRFLRRDIRLSGEGSWHLPLLSSRRKAA